MIKRFLSWAGSKFGLSSGSIATQKTITDEWIPSSFRVGTNTSGEVVTHSNALTISAVWDCVNAISQDIAKVPFHCYRASDRGKDRVSNNIDTILNYRPNPYTNAMDFRQTLTAHVLLYGNAFAEIQRDINNNVVALWVLPADRTTPNVEAGELRYTVQTKDGPKHLWPEEVLHIKGLGFDGLQGYSVITWAAQSLGSALAADKYAGAFWGNGSTVGGWIKHPGNASENSKKNIRDSVEARHQGAANAHRIGLLEEGMDFVDTTIPPESAQFLQTRQFHISEICRWFRVPPHKVADLTHATFSNIEEQNIEYVTDCLSTWCRRWEQEVWAKLFSQDEQEQGYFAEHTLEGLLRGNILTRYQAYAIGRQWGWLSINKICEKENMNTIGEAGDIHLSPMNMVDVNALGAAPAPTAPQARLLAKDIAERLGKAELRELDKQLAREDFDPELFEQWASRFYSKHNEYVTKTLSVVSSNIDPTAFTLQKSLEQAENKRGVFEAQQNTHIDLLQERINELFQS